VHSVHEVRRVKKARSTKGADARTGVDISAVPRSLAALAHTIETCTRCPELRAYCAEVARTKRRAYAADDYWGRPVPGFGDPRARIWILGLAPAAHGANRTGRMFTGDRSGDFLCAALHRAGQANQPSSVSREDGLVLKDVWISSSLRCAPPANKPSTAQLERCLPHLDAEWDLLRDARVLFCLGGIAWNAALDLLARRGHDVPQPRPKFAHDALAVIGTRTLVASYHVSQQNTFTGRLTPAMLDARIARAIQIARREQKS
jgi:uracil-DNA glycosylase family 4